MLNLSVLSTQRQQTKHLHLRTFAFPRMRSRSRLSGCCVVIVVDMDSLRHTQAWLLLLFLTQTIDQNAGIAGCCYQVWGVLSFAVVYRQCCVSPPCKRVYSTVVSSLLCHAQSLAHDGLGCRFASTHLERLLFQRTYLKKRASYSNH